MLPPELEWECWVAGEPQRSRGRLRLPVHGLRRLRIRREVEEHHAQLDGRDPVNHRVVHLPQDRRAPAGHARHDQDLPERPVAPQLSGEEAVGEGAQVRPRERVGRLDHTNVAPELLRSDVLG